MFSERRWGAGLLNNSQSCDLLAPPTSYGLGSGDARDANDTFGRIDPLSVLKLSPVEGLLELRVAWEAHLEEGAGEEGAGRGEEGGRGGGRHTLGSHPFH